MPTPTSVAVFLRLRFLLCHGLRTRLELEKAHGGVKLRAVNLFSDMRRSTDRDHKGLYYVHTDRFACACVCVDVYI